LFRFAIIYSDFFTCCSATNKKFKFGLRLKNLQEKIINRAFNNIQLNNFKLPYCTTDIDDVLKVEA